MKKLLNNKKGETLVETLAAILIFTMASIVLYSMVTTAANINSEAREHDEMIAGQREVAEHLIQVDASHPEISNLTVTVCNGRGADAHEIPETAKTIQVQVFRETTDKECLASYFAVPDASAAEGGSGK